MASLRSLVSKAASTGIYPVHLLPNHRTRNSFRLLHLSARRSFTSVNRTPGLTHIDESGRPRVVDVGSKVITSRLAVATGSITLPISALDLVLPQESNSSASVNRTTIVNDLERQKEKARQKGDILTVAQLAGIMAAKATSSLIPLCHPLPLTRVDVKFLTVPEDRKIVCEACVSCDGKTGVEMEALTAVSVSLLTVWDMMKAVAGKEMTVSCPSSFSQFLF